MATLEQPEHPATAHERPDIGVSRQAVLLVWCGLAAAAWAVMIGFAFGVRLVVEALT